MKERTQNLLIVILSSILTLFMCELGYRILVFKSVFVGSNIATSHHFFCEYDPLLGWRHKKNIQARFVNKEYESLLAFNSKGLRGPEIAYEKGNNIYRILVLGDSFTESYTVNLADSFPELLEKNLAGGIAHKNVQVINTGVGGYSTDQEYLYMKEEGQKFHPDLTILMFCENDVYFNDQPSYYGRGFKPYFKLENGGLVLKNIPVPKPPLEAAPNPILKFWPKSYLRLYLKDRLKAKEKNRKHKFPNEQKIRLINYDQATQYEWEITEKLIQEIKLLAVQNGGNFLVVYIPTNILVEDKLLDVYLKTFASLNGKIDVQKPRAVLKDLCARNEIEFLDLTDPLRSRSQGRSLYIKNDGHWNKEGHHAVGQVLAEHISHADLGK